MKKFSIVVSVLLMLVVSSIALVGCGVSASELNALKDRIEELEGEVDGHTDDIAELTTRIDKIESTVSAIEALVGGTEEYDFLVESLEEVRSGLLANSLADAELKAIVTTMQAQVDDVVINQGQNSEALSVTQATLNKLYGATFKDDFKRGDVIPIGRNGIVYYTVQVEAEFHDGKVSNPAEGMPTCKSIPMKHYCGYITINNINWLTIKDEMDNIMRPAPEGDIIYSRYTIQSVSLAGVPSGLPDILQGTSGVRHFRFSHDLYSKPFDMVFYLDDGSGFLEVAAVIRNFYDGKEQPIIGFK